MSPRVLSQSLLDNYHNALVLVRQAIVAFDDRQWRRDGTTLQVPWKLAYHTVECLDYFFRDDGQRPFPWGYRFGGGWWSLTPAQMPAQADVLAYLDEVESRIMDHLASLTDAQLATPFDSEKEHGDTRLGHYIYGLRHTMHHHGEMSLLSLQAGNPEGSWL